jgi:hypothetical protein
MLANGNWLREDRYSNSDDVSEFIPLFPSALCEVRYKSSPHNSNN